MSVTFISSGQKVYVESSPEGTRNVKLKPAIYTLECSREEGLHLLDIQDKYSLPKKVYGKHEEAVKRVIHTHLSKKGNTGILLTGLKGTGKSLFVKFLSNQMLKQGYPIIQVNKAYSGEDLFNFVENLGDCVILFDEFGKNYSPYNSSGTPSQSSLLSMLDGLSNSKRLHLFTENSQDDITQYMINRPGRVHYHFKYNRLSNDIIKEFCEDSEVPKEVTEELLALVSKIKVLSFDVVKCLIDEWKLYGGALEDLIHTLNITLLSDTNKGSLKIISYIAADGTTIDFSKLEARLMGDYVYLDLKNTGDSYAFNSIQNERLDLSSVISVDGDIYTFKTDKGSVVKLYIDTPLNN